MLELSDAYPRLPSAGGFKHRAKVEICCAIQFFRETTRKAPHTEDVSGVPIPGGFGIRGTRAKIGAIVLRAGAWLPVLGPPRFVAL